MIPSPTLLPGSVFERGGGIRDVHAFFGSEKEFGERFGSEEACRDFLYKQRWPGGFRCPRRCPGTSFRWLDSKSMKCLRCYRRVSLTAGTILHGTKKPLSTWFRAAFLVAHEGTNARTLQRRLKLTYKIAWLWAQKLRRVMARKTTLDAPVPPFDPARGNHPRFRLLWFANHGGFKWEAHRQGGLGTCCARLDHTDWDYPDPKERGRWAALRHSPGLVREKETLFNTYMGSVSDKHLRAYLDETQFRANYRGVSAVERGTELARRFMETPPCSYRWITGRKKTDKKRPPLWIAGPPLPELPAR